MSFRDWMNVLKNTHGDRPLWPCLLGATLNAEFQRQREEDRSYKGAVFKDRDSHPLADGEREERLVARLYRSCLEQTAGVITLDQHTIWLLGFQWPNQGAGPQKGRRADLVGLTEEGGLVVFEAKARLGDEPLVAIVEGLDYLSCLLRPGNFDKIQTGFNDWVRKPGKLRPTGFETTIPSRDVKPWLVILAPDGYYSGTHNRSLRRKDWPTLDAASENLLPSVRLAFAVTDFKSPNLQRPGPHEFK